jgi:predicted DNA-binding protein with PD1-like motif
MNLYNANEYNFEKIAVVKIKENSDILESIKDYCRQNNIRGAVIIGGVGGLKKVKCRNAKCFSAILPYKPEQLFVKTVDKPLEILNLSGWIARSNNNDPVIHSHISCSYFDGDDIKTVGGHLMPGSLAWIMTTVTIGILREELSVTLDKDTNWYDLSF